MSVEAYGSPEMALLMAASRGDPNSESVRRLMARKLDWARLTQLAVLHRATPRLWSVVSAYPNLPTEATTLQTVAVVDDFRRHHIRNLILRVVADLRTKNIEVLALKGAAMMVGAVQQPAVRSMADIDLLIISGSPEVDWNACQASGWTPLDTALTEEMYRDHHHLPPLQDPDGVGIGLELHRGLTGGVHRIGIDMSALLARSRVLMVGTVPVRVSSLEDLLLHLCLHFGWSNKLQGGAWRAFTDAHAILSDPGFSWDRFVQLVGPPRAKKCCYWTLRLGALVADLPVPRDVLQRLDPSSGGRLATLLERHFATQVAQDELAEPVSERVRRWLWFAAMGESSRSAEADGIWSDGALDLAPEVNASPTRRTAFAAAVGTVAYIARLTARTSS